MPFIASERGTSVCHALILIDRQWMASLYTGRMPRPGQLAALLAALAMLAPFSIDAYLPAFPAIAQSLGAEPIAVQQTITAYMFAFGGMILWHGAISDAFGRRLPILVALFVFELASLGCALSTSIGMLLAFRVLQGLSGGAGIVIGRAMIRDIYAGPTAERLMALVTMIFALGPAIAPVLGGYIVTVAGWRGIFVFLALYTLVLAAAAFWLLPETLPQVLRKPLHARVLAESYWRVFSTWRFHCYAGTVAFNFGGLFLYVAAAPVFLIEHLHLSPRQFIWLFAPLVAGMFLGALTVNRLAGRTRLSSQVRIGFVLMGVAAVSNLAYHLSFSPRIPYSVAGLLLYSFGMALVAPGVTLMVLDLFPEIRGIAASCQSATQTILGAIIAGLIAPLLSPSVVWLALGQCAFVALAILAWHAGGPPPRRPAITVAAA